MRTPLFAISLMLVTSSLLSGCQNADATQPSQVEVPPVAVEVTPAARATLHASIQTSTVLEALNEADVTPRVNGVIERILVEEGDQVTAGQVLAQLDSERFLQAVNQVAAELRGVEQELQRMQTMANRQLASLDSLERLQANRDALQARLRLAQIDLESATIRAPIDGVISRRYAKIGNLVQLHSAQSLFHIVDLNSLQATLHIPERDISRIRVGHPVVLAFNDMQVDAQVSRISPAVDRVAGTFRVQVDIDNRSQGLRAGMFARAQVHYATHIDTLRIPNDAIVELDGKSYIYVIAQEHSERRAIRTGIRQGQWVEVVEGVHEGEQVVVTGQNNLQDNRKVVAIVAANQPPRATE